MTLDIHYDLPSYEAAVSRFAWTVFWRKCRIALLVAACFLVPFYLTLSGPDGDASARIAIVSAVMMAAILLLYVFYDYFCTTVIALKRHVREFFSSSARITLSEQSFVYSTEEHKVTLRWEQIVSFPQFHGYGLLILRSGGFLGIPLVDVPDEAVRFIEAHIRK